ncbi:MAG: hypothetical protein V1921_02650 [Candidatus Altiarchaeota archaeon]
MASELSLYGPILDTFDDGFEPFEEVRTHPEKSYRKSMDLVFKRKSTGRLTSVEVKVSDWRRALRQAALNTSYCHYNYVAIPHNLAARLDVGTFRELGVGILSIKKGECKVISKSRLSSPLKRGKNEVLRQIQCSRRKVHRKSKGSL